MASNSALSTYSNVSSATMPEKVVMERIFSFISLIYPCKSYNFISRSMIAILISSTYIFISSTSFVFCSALSSDILIISFRSRISPLATLFSYKSSVSYLLSSVSFLFSSSCCLTFFSSLSTCKSYPNFILSILFSNIFCTDPFISWSLYTCSDNLTFSYIFSCS